MMSLSVRRTSDEALCILAWQLPRVAAVTIRIFMCMFLRHFPTRKQSGKKIGGNEQTKVFEHQSGTGHMLALMRSDVHELSVPFL
ncbi:hypothetical protein Tco_0798128 [Tanacetum coccineum]